MASQTIRGFLPIGLVASALIFAVHSGVQAQPKNLSLPSIVQHIRSANERLEMTVNTSRILTMDNKIPQVQVNNPNILELTTLSPTEIQISAKSPGVTQVNLWDVNKQVYTVDVIVYGDSSELRMLLENQFPNASLSVKQISDGVLISGYVDDPSDISLIVQIAEEYYPKVLTAIKVGGVHQVLLHVKVMEVSRTKLRTLGLDWWHASSDSIVSSMASGLIAAASPTAIASGAENFLFSVAGSSSLFTVLEALREDQLAKILAEPTLVTVSGRPAYFLSGGSFPILVPQGLGSVAIEFQDFGTQVDFVPVVLGNGNIHLEVRPRVSEIDNTRGVTVEGMTVPGLRVREVDTAVEMMAGQTLAIAGLVQNRVESQRRGLPWLGELPYLGVLFRRVHEENNEVELLIMVTPELIEAVDADQVPAGGPGSRTTSPNDWDLFMKGHIEVPNCCPQDSTSGNPGAYGRPEMAEPGMILDPQRPIQTSGSMPQPPMPQPSMNSSTMSWSTSGGFSGPLARHNPSSPYTPSRTATRTGRNELPGFIGAVGYESWR